jgi:hypothetical protein
VEAPVEASVQASVEPLSLDQDSPPAVVVKEIPVPEPLDSDPDSDAIFVFEEDAGTIEAVDPPVADAVDAVVEPLSLDEDSPPAVVVEEIPAPEPLDPDPDSDAIFVFEEDPGIIDAVAAPVVDAVEATEEAASDAPLEETDLRAEWNEDAPPLTEVIDPEDDEPESPASVAEGPATESPESVEADSLPSPTASVEEPRPPLPVELPEIRIESSEEAFRDLPPFLDDAAEAPAPRPVSLSERDADRALIALAEARARVERSQLLRVRSVPDEAPVILPEPEIEAAIEAEIESEIESEIEPAATIPLPEPETLVELETASIAVADLETPAAELESWPTEESAEPPQPETAELAADEPPSELVGPDLVPAVALVDGPAPEPEPETVSEPEAAPEPDLVSEPGVVSETEADPESDVDALDLFRGERFLRRVERFGEEARRRLDAREVIVCDRDGLILYSDVEERAGGVLETALLLEVSAKTNRLLGLSTSRATQVSVGGGLWRCLLKESGAGGDLYAGLLLPEPLEEGQIDFWTRALSEVTGAPALTVT